jgi:hypothetical protein
MRPMQPKPLDTPIIIVFEHTQTYSKDSNLSQAYWMGPGHMGGYIHRPQQYQWMARACAAKHRVLSSEPGCAPARPLHAG